MRTFLHPDDVAGRPVEELATSEPPERWHDALLQLGTHQRNGSWVVAGARDVAAALSSAALSVAPAAGPDGPAARLIASTARFSDGADHRRRRDLLVSMLPPVAAVATAAGARASDYLLRRTAAFDIMPAARKLPAQVLAQTLGLPAAEAERAAALTGALCDAVTPSLRPREGTSGDADRAVVELAALLAGGLGNDEDRITAAISILLQARDATAALIGTAIAAGRRGSRAAAAAPVRRRIEDVLRHDAPVRCTRRTAAAETVIGDAKIPAGAPLWIFIATAERGSGRPATFGSGPHACPGAAQAAAIARQVVAVLEADGWRAVRGQRIDLEPRPNIRVPAQVLMART